MANALTTSRLVLCVSSIFISGTQPCLSHVHVLTSTLTCFCSPFVHVPSVSLFTDPKQAPPSCQKWGSSGQNDPNNFDTYFNGDTVPNYMLAMIMQHKMLVDVINRELGGDISTEGGGAGSGEQGTASTRAARVNAAAKRRAEVGLEALQSMARSSEEMARSTKRRGPSELVRKFLAALREAKAADAPAEVCEEIEMQLSDTVREMRAERESPASVGASAVGVDTRSDGGSDKGVAVGDAGAPSSGEE